MPVAPFIFLNIFYIQNRKLSSKKAKNNEKRIFLIFYFSKSNRTLKLL